VRTPLDLAPPGGAWAVVQWASRRSLVLAAQTMSHKHEQLLRTLFHDPVSGNIHWREIESLLNHVGAQIEPLSGARLRVKIGKVEGILHRPHHGNTLDRNAVQYLREFLGHAGVTPSLYEQREQDRAKAVG
jgi:hypothetical protein